MKRDELGDLVVFLAVAEERSFTRAAARLGTSQSSLSHAMRRLEERLGIRLLMRTTRTVAATEAGEELAATLRPALTDIQKQLEALSSLRERPAGTIRLTASAHAARTLVLPAAMKLMADYPDINIEIAIDQKLVDIVAERYDGGIRLGEQVEKDMVAVRIGPEMRMAVVGSPDYLARNPAPATPHELTRHKCINLRLPTYGGLYAWEFEKDGRPLNVRVDGQFVCNDVPIIVNAALGGTGLACLTEDLLLPYIEDGRLIRVLGDWCPPFPGFHLYYPSRRQHSAAFDLLVEALRYRE